MAEEHPKIMLRPLPQVLDEIDTNIRAAAEAARKAEEASKAARAAAGSATKASDEAAKMAEKAAEDATRAAAKAATKAEEIAKAARAAAEEAAKKAEEAERETREATGVFQKAAAETARKTEKITATLLQRVELLEEKLKSLENALPKEEIVMLREISKEEAEKEILELFSQGKTLYYSDIAEQLGLDLKLVVEICNKLQSRGEIEVVDDTLQRR